MLLDILGANIATICALIGNQCHLCEHQRSVEINLIYDIVSHPFPLSNTCSLADEFPADNSKLCLMTESIYL